MPEIPFINKEQLIGVVARNSSDYIDLVFQALEAGKTVVPLRGADDDQRIKATGLRELRQPNSGSGWFRPRFSPQRNDAIAQISFTSGTEGAPKGVILSHRALNDTVNRLLMVSAVNSSVKEYIGVPVYHSFGYARCRLIAKVNGHAYLPENGFNPREIAEMLYSGQINALSAVPSMLRVLLEHAGIFINGCNNLRWIEIGSQPMSVEEKQQLRALFPEANIVQHYGLTEASRTSLLQIDNASLTELGSVGRAYGDTQIKISDQGTICIKGSHLASGLLIEGQWQPLPGSEGWFETSDLGRLENEYLYFMGRADNLINCGGQKISAELIEDALRLRYSIPAGIAVTRIEDSVYGEAVLLARDRSCPIHSDDLYQAAREILSENGVSASNALHLYECDALPVTETGKVQRRIISDRYQQSTTPQTAASVQVSLHVPDDREGWLVKSFQKKADPRHRVTAQDSCDTLGLDSIAAVSLSMVLEQHLGHIPHQWRRMTIAELARLERLTPSGSVPPKFSAIGGVKGANNENPAGIGFWALVKEDFITHDRDWLAQGFWAIFNHRFGNWRMGIKSKLLRAPLTLLYRFHRRLVQIFCGIKLDYTVKLGRRVKLEHFGGMILGATSIGDDVTIRQNTTFGIRDLSDLQGKPIIEQGVNIGTGAVVVGAITVGRFSVLGPNVVVDHDIPPFSVVSVVPSRVQSLAASAEESPLP